MAVWIIWAAFILFHLLYVFLNKGDFVLVKPVLRVKLAVDLWDWFRPIDVGVGGEVLEGDQ